MKELPQILLMENVPAIVSDKFVGSFAEWIAFLDLLGYKSKWAILNAKDYGIPQNRERCFMVSWLGDYFYEFPESVKLDLRLKDMLEKEVDDRYWLSDYAMRQFQVHKDRNAMNGNGFGVSYVEGGVSRTPLIAGQTDLTATTSEHAAIEYVGSVRPYKQIQNRSRVIGQNGICHTLTATDYKDPPKVAVDAPARADGIYTGVTEPFQRGPLKDGSRTIKATQHDAGVVIYGESVQDGWHTDRR